MSLAQACCSGLWVTVPEQRLCAHRLLPPTWIAVPFTALLHMPWAEVWPWPFCTRNWSEWPVWGLCTRPTMSKWNYFLCPSTQEKKVRLYFITQILFLILGNVSWALLVTGGGMLVWSELSGRILEGRGRWLAWITLFPLQCGPPADSTVQFLPYSIWDFDLENKWRTEQLYHFVMLWGGLRMSGPIHALILSRSLTVAVPGMVVSVGSKVRHLDLDLCLTTYETHDLGRITQLLWVWGASSTKWGLNKTHNICKVLNVVPGTW